MSTVEVNFNKPIWRISLYLLGLFVFLATFAAQVWLFRHDFAYFSVMNIVELIILVVLLVPPLKLNTRLHENIHRLVMEFFGATDVTIDYRSLFPSATSNHIFTPKQYCTIALAPLVTIIIPIMILVLYFSPALILYISWIIMAGTGDIVASLLIMKYIGKDVGLQDIKTGFIVRGN